jgi:HlyD family type I secretion membrane fusion protein
MSVSSAIDAATTRDELIAALTGPANKTSFFSRWATTGMFLAGAAIIAFVPISSGVPAQGLLSPTKPRQIIQHQTGGTVRHILVKDGQAVTAGQVLIRLDDTQERAAAGIAASQVISLRAELAVRQAEVRGLPGVAFPSELERRAQREPDVRALLDSQLAAFDARKQSNSNRIAQIQQQLAKNSRSAAQARARAGASAQQLAMVREETAMARGLYDKGLMVKSRVLALERGGASLNADVTSFNAEIGRLQAENAELSKRLQQPDLEVRVQASEAMRTIHAELAAAQDRLNATQTALERTVIRAPLAGRVLSLRAATIGGVMRPGEPILEIVPDDSRLQLKARIRLADADNIREGMPAVIRFDMMQGTSVPQITGELQTISADVIEDPRTGETFFEAKIAITPEEARRLPRSTFAPGRPAEVLIQTGSRTLLTYFLAPLDRAQFKALREE